MEDDKLNIVLLNKVHITSCRDALGNIASFVYFLHEHLMPCVLYCNILNCKELRHQNGIWQQTLEEMESAKDDVVALLRTINLSLVAWQCYKHLILAENSLSL